MVIILRFIFFFFLFGIFFSNAVLQIATVLLLPFAVYLFIIKLRENKLTTFELLIVLLFLSSMLSVYLSYQPSIAGKNILYHSILLSILPISYLMQKDNHVSLISLGKILSLFAFAISVMGIVRYLNGAERAYGFFSSYYTLAATLAFTIPLTFAFVFYSKSTWKYLTIVSTIIQFAALWLTFTRSTLLGLIAALIIIALILFTRAGLSTVVKRRIVFSSVFILALVFILLFTSSDSRLNPILALSNPDLSSGRNEIYSDAYRVIWYDLKGNLGNILFGHGLESRVVMFPKSQFTSWESDYLETFISQGLIGLVLIILIYLQFLKEVVKLYFKAESTRYSKFVLGILASGISFWVISFFSSQLVGRISSAYFVILYSLIVLIRKTFQRNETPAATN